MRSASKPEWKKRDKQTRQLLPLTDEAVHDHLSGKITIGVYPLLLDETCWFLAVDVDQWRYLREQAERVFVLKGGMGTKQRAQLAGDLAATENSPRVIVATGSHIGEGFDDSRLDTLFLTMPISGRGTLQQYVGRLHRLHDSKKVVEVYDYVDGLIPVLARMFEKRLRGYRALGYAIRPSGPGLAVRPM